MQPLNAEEFLSFAATAPIIDVRSPGEYAHAHIPGAYSLPLFTDEERKIVGTAYKQQSREVAIKIGLDFFGVKMRKMVEEAEQIVAIHQKQVPENEANEKNILLHCWRGGMRSAAVAWLLDLYGFRVTKLAGGYKAYRNWVSLQYEREYDFRILGGYTGSGKTHVIHELAKSRAPVIDLEGIAKHKGSAFGGFDHVQPSQEMFENLLADALFQEHKKANRKPIWLEDESRRIGNVNLPQNLWNTIRKSPVYFLEIPFEERLQHIVSEYSLYSKEQLSNSILRIQKRLGGVATKNAISYLDEDNYIECFRILLTYYDKYYKSSLHNRENLDKLLYVKQCEHVDAVANTDRLMELLQTN